MSMSAHIARKESERLTRSPKREAGKNRQPRPITYRVSVLACPQCRCMRVAYWSQCLVCARRLSTGQRPESGRIWSERIYGALAVAAMLIAAYLMTFLPSHSLAAGHGG